MTNFEQMRTLPLERMAKWLTNENVFCSPVNCPAKIDGEDRCYTCLKQWLNAEAEAAEAASLED